MAKKRIGKWTVRLEEPPVIRATAAVAGKMEGEGPLGHEFDQIYADLIMGQKSFEAAEKKMMEDACTLALQKAGLDGTPPKVDYFLAGDLLNQIITSTFSALEIRVPFLGLYGACSTFCESLSIGAMLIDGGFADRILCATSSHNASAERQYRYPVEYGGQRKPYAQTTVTGSGAVILAAEGDGPRITHVTNGRVVDMGIADPFNQGAAMAPAAVETLLAHFHDTGRSPGDYDLIVTGDLATFGHEVAVELAAQKGLELGPNYQDCGMLIFDRTKQHVDSGGSGCGCSAIVTCGHLIPEMRRGNLKKILVVATGALLSPTTFQQGENIPAVAHAVAIEV
ncbi:MAG TPA: stage V sporulation protein AD [Symbiobacteriaceae bacterium]|nr:stage V sporulation protein AD [Symbiobacteriaceae bacterium]